MNIPSLLRSLRKKFFGATPARRKPFRRSQRFDLEMLETRLAPALPPKILSVIPKDFSIAGDNTSNPAIVITFNEAMDATDVKNVANYRLFRDDATVVPISSVDYDPVAFTATVNYGFPPTPTNPNGLLPAGDAYTLFVVGDRIHDAGDTATLANQGQLATTNAGPSTVSTITVAGDGTLNAITSVPTGQSRNVAFTPPPLLVATGDFDGDGINDVAMLDNTVKAAAHINIYLGTGKGQFNPTPFPLSLPATATGVNALAAFPEQTTPGAGPIGLDLAVTDAATANVYWFSNKTLTPGMMVFSQGQRKVGKAPAGLAAADLDADGFTDLAVVDQALDTRVVKGFQWSDWEIDVLGQDSGTPGTFKAPVIISVGTEQEPVVPHDNQGLRNPINLAAGDLRTVIAPGLTGAHDLAVTGSNGVMVLLNTTTSAGNFQFLNTYNPPPAPPGPSAGRPATFALRLGPTFGYNYVAIAPFTHPIATTGPTFVSDIVVSTPNGTITVYPNLGAGTAFGAGVTINLGHPVRSFVLSALGPATVPGVPTGPVAILVPNTEANTFQVIPNLSAPGVPVMGAPVSYRVDNGPFALAVGEMNGDANIDVVTVNTGVALPPLPTLTGQSFSLARGDGKGAFLVAPTINEASNAAPDAVAVGDVNGDGIKDLVVADSGLDQVEVYLGTAPAFAGGPVTYVIPPATYPIVDGGKGHKPVTVALANLSGQFYTDPVTHLQDPTAPILDIVTGDYSDNYVSILANTGTSTTPTGTFAKAKAVAVGAGPTQVIAGLFKTLVAQLVSAISDTATTIIVTATSALPTSAGFLIRIDDEYMQVTAINSTSLTVTRGVGGSKAVKHDALAAVQKLADDLVVSHNGIGSLTSSQGVTVLINANKGDRSFQVVFDPAASAGQHATAVAAGDFDNDGNLDFVFTNSPTDGSPGSVIEMLGHGNRVFTSNTDLMTRLFSQFATPFVVSAMPTALAVADVNRDGYLDVIVGSADPNNPGQAIGVLFSSVGTGFDSSPVYTSNVLPANVTVQALTVTDFYDTNGNIDPYPDLVVTPTPLGAGAVNPVVNGVIRLLGHANGVFSNPLQYEAGGPPSPVVGLPVTTPIAVISDPLVRVVTFRKGGNVVESNLLLNGNFEARDLSQGPGIPGEQGNITGWLTANVTDSRGAWSSQTGTFSPLSRIPVPGPTPATTYQAMLDQSNIIPLRPGDPVNPNVYASYSGTNYLYQDVTIPANLPTIQILTLTGATPGTTTFQLSLNGATTGNILYTGTAADAGAIQTALNNLSTVTGVGGVVTVASQATAGSWQITLGGGLMPYDQSLGLVPSTQGTIVTQQHGSGILSATLNLTLYLKNLSINGTWATGPADPTTTLDYRTAQPDQQVRVDLVNPDDPLFGDTTAYNPVTNTGAVYQLAGRKSNTVFVTDQGTTLDGFVPLTETTNIDVSGLAGKRVRLRIAATNNRGQLVVGVDNASLNVLFSDTVTPTFNPPTLRNPGFATGQNNSANTTDTTVTGRVNPLGADGGPANIAYVQFAFTDASGIAQVYKIGRTSLDAQGNYQKTLLGLPFGTTKVTVTVVDKAGNQSAAAISFINQGPSLNGWQAVGPGAITTDGSVKYKTVSGRVTATVTDPADTSGNTYYVGSVNGGVWKTTDGGADWTPLTDYIFNAQGQAVDVGVGAIALAKVNPPGQKVIYVATGVGDLLPDSRDGVGVIVSRDGGATWQVAGNSATVLGPGSAGGFTWPGARVTAMAVDPNNSSKVYVAVAAGGQFGPGVYKSGDAGATWNIVTTPTSMNLAGLNVSVSNLASVTSLVIDPRNNDDITIGMGNIGMVPGSPTAGIWKSTTFGATWFPVLGGDDKRIPNNTVPSDLTHTGGGGSAFVVGRVTVTQAYGIGSDIATFYALIGNPPTPYPTTFPFVTPGGNFSYGTGVQGAGLAAGLYKSSNGMLDWTKVMVRTNVTIAPGDPDNPPVFQDVNLLGNSASNIGALVVDPTNPNVVYVGGADNWQPAQDSPVPESPGLIRVDTGNMMDAMLAKAENYRTSETYFWGLVSTIGAPVGGFNANLNNGDDIGKYIASLSPNGHSAGKYPSDDGGGNYLGEGVSWFDLETGTYAPAIVNAPYAPSPNGGPYPAQIGPVKPNLPGQIGALAIDAQGRLLVGTFQGIYRVASHGISYDYASGSDDGTPTNRGAGIMTDTTGGTGPIPLPSVTITPLNGNLQISNLSSVSSDPVVAGRYYAAGYDTGAQETTLTLGVGLAVGWQSMGLQGGIGPYDPQVGVQHTGQYNYDAGTVLTAPVDPTAPANLPTTVYDNYAFTHTAFGFDPRVSPNLGGVVGTFNQVKPKNAGISVNDNSGYFPVMAISPVKLFDNGFYQDVLVYGTDRIYTSRTSTNLWDDRVGHALSSLQGSVVTAIGIAPTNKNDNNQVFYVGSNMGELWVDQHNGKDLWPLLNVGLPSAPVTSITVSPSNPQVAYVTFGGNGTYQHVWVTATAGKKWAPLQNTKVNSLPNVPMYSFAIDPRSQPQAGAPVGHLYIGTEVGTFVSVDNGSTWQRLGIGLPNVPTVSLQLNTKLEELVVGTQGRGVFEISTDRQGGQFITAPTNSPTTPVHALNSVTVTFSKAVGSFPASAVNIIAPNGYTATVVGSPTDVSTPLPGPMQINPHNTWQINFQVQVASTGLQASAQPDGAYTFRIGPSVLDQLGNPMDQNQNKINGEGGTDVYQTQYAVNNTDDGLFVAGMFNDLLNRPADITGFLSLLNLVDPVRFAKLPNFASSFVGSNDARAVLIQDLYTSTAASAPFSIIGIGNLLPGYVFNGNEVPFWEKQLAAGAPVEAIINNLLASNAFFTQPLVGGTDVNFLNQAYVDLFGHGLDSPPTTFQQQLLDSLTSAEGASRLQQALALMNGNNNNNLYIDNYVTTAYGSYLGRPPTTTPNGGELAAWERAFHSGITQQQFLNNLIGSQGFYNYAPTLIGAPLGTQPTNTTFIQAVYKQLFTCTSITPPDSGVPTDNEVNYWLGKMAGGMTTTQVGATLLGTSRYLTDFIYNTYAAVLLRTPTTTGPNPELNFWLKNLQSGGTQQGMLANLIASQEYFQNQFGGATTLAQQDLNWTKGMYVTACNQNFNDTDPPVVSVTNALAGAELAARTVVAQKLTATADYQNVIINNVYDNLLANDPLHPNGATTTELSLWRGVLSQPSAGPGQLSRDEQMIASLLGSSNYFYLQTDLSNGLHTNQSWVNGLYQSLDVPTNTTAANNLVNSVLASYQPQREQAASILANSTEYRTLTINQDYQTYLRRSPTPQEVSSWLQQYALGVTHEQVIASLLASDAYFTLSPSIIHVGNLASNATFVRAVYNDLFPYLNNPSNSQLYTIYQQGVSYYVNQLNTGQLSRAQVALQLTTSTRYLFQIFDDPSSAARYGLVNSLYFRFIARDVSQGEISNFWMPFYATGGRDEGVISNLLGSTSYFYPPPSRAHKFP